MQIARLVYGTRLEGKDLLPPLYAATLGSMHERLFTITGFNLHRDNTEYGQSWLITMTLESTASQREHRSGHWWLKHP